MYVCRLFPYNIIEKEKFTLLKKCPAAKESIISKLFVFPIYRYCKRDGVESFSLVEFLEGGEPASVRKESCNLKPILLAALGATGRAWLRDVHLQNAQGSESKKKEIIIKLIQIQTAGKNKYVSFSLITIKIYKNISDNLTYFLFKHIL